MANQFHDPTLEQLHKTVTDLREKLRVIRFSEAGSRSRNVREERSVRRDIARALTEIRARTIADAAQVASNAKKA